MRSWLPLLLLASCHTTPPWPEEGVTVAGLKLTIEPVHSKVRLGNPIEIRVTVTNRSDHEAAFFGDSSKYSVRRDDSSWDVVLAPPNPEGFLEMGEVLKSGESHTWTISLESPRHPGELTVRAREREDGPRSNIIRILIENVP